MSTLKYRDYDIDDFNDDGSLKVSATLWIAILYLARHVLLLAMGGLSTLVGSRMGQDTGGFSALYSSPIFLLASVPALIVMATTLRRVPRAGPLIRRLWRSGRWLLVAAATADLVFLAWQVLWLQHPAPGAPHVGQAILDLYAMAFLLRSARVRDTFADFPQAPEPRTG